jgi:hypothetical protein
MSGGVFTARPDQRKVVGTALTQLTSGARATVVSACGTGKRLIAALTAEGLKARRVLVAAPTLDLLAQTVRAWSLAGARGSSSESRRGGGGACPRRLVLVGDIERKPIRKAVLGRCASRGQPP